ncbi:MAG: hypothetical protein AAFU55_11940, partial [Pseudomonadota bacterium]
MTLQAQSFATVVFADAKLERIRAVAANLGAVTGVEAEKALGEDVAAILGLHATHSCRNALGYPHIDGVPEVIPFTGSNGRRLEASVHSIADGAAMEIADSLVNPRSHNLLARFAAMAPSLANLPAATADAVRGAAGCDQAIALGPGGEPSAIASLGAVGAEDALQSLMERDAAFEVLRDVEAPLIELRGEDNRWAAPLVLTLSHSEALVRFARAIGARGAVFVRASSVAVVAWSAQPLVVSFGMAQAIGLIAKFADQAAHSVETSERSQRLTLMSDILILEDDRQLSRRWKDALTGAGH